MLGTTADSAITLDQLRIFVAALGLQSDFLKLKARGIRPLLLSVSASAFILLFSLVLVKSLL